jgi:nickel-dependent lactate racemase
MTTVKLPFGHSKLDVRVDQFNPREILAVPTHHDETDETGLLRESLSHPIGSQRLSDLAREGQKVTLVASDMTRPCPTRRLLPPVLDELTKAGVPDSDVTIVIALGLHRAMDEDELEAAVGPDVYRRVRVINHDPEQVSRIGVTSFGTPVEIFTPVVESDLRICLGNIEFHYFAGFSGGAKAIMPGCASRATVEANHRLMTESEAQAGQLEGNPVRADLEEGVAMLGIDFILNVVVDDAHRVVAAFSGDCTAAHRRGCEMVAKRGTAPISKLADVVLVSGGGYPKDINLYQAQKALDNAAHAVRPGGIIILAAECSEGLGNQTFEQWMDDANTPDDLISRLQDSFELGGHKAAAIATVQKRADLYLVSDLPDELVRTCGMIPFASIDKALEAALAQSESPASLVVMPQGGGVLPRLVP